MLERSAVKVARSVLRGGKPERANLSQLDTPVVLAENAECHRLGSQCWPINESVSIPPQE
jgi:hypothetical protein